MIRAIIIDDEPDSLESLRLAVTNYCKSVDVIAAFDSPFEGVTAIKKLKPDLVFLDVQMPQMSGFDVLQQFDKLSFEVIFVTAYNHYAVKAIKFSALDYLLKPVEIDELQRAVKKAEEKINSGPPSLHVRTARAEEPAKPSFEKIAIPTSEGLLMIDCKDIIRCVAIDNYTEIHVSNQPKLLVTKTLKEFEELLEPHHFFRVHHSHLINLNRIVKYFKGEGGYVLMSDGVQVDVSRRKKEEFLARLKIV